MWTYNPFTHTFDWFVTGLTKSQADTYYYPLSTNPEGYLTGLTVGTTPIASGTDGYVLWQQSGKLAEIIASYVNTNNSIVLRDSAGNSAFNNVVRTVTQTNSANQTIAMTYGSSFGQETYGTSNVTFNLPDATYLYQGEAFEFNNNSTGIITIYKHDGTTLVGIVISMGYGKVICDNNSTVNGEWDIHFYIPSGASSQFVKGDGSLDSNSYLSSIPTLQDVTDAGSSTTNNIEANQLTSDTSLTSDGNNFYTDGSGNVYTKSITGSVGGTPNWYIDANGNGYFFGILKTGYNTLDDGLGNAKFTGQVTTGYLYSDYGYFYTDGSGNVYTKSITGSVGGTPNWYIDANGNGYFFGSLKTGYNTLDDGNGNVKCVRDFSLTGLQTGTLISPPTINIGDLWMDTTTSSQYPIVRIRAY